MTENENVDQTLAMIEATNSMADAMDAMKQAMEQRGWSSAMAEQVGAAFGSTLFSMMNPPKPGRRR